MPIAIITLVIEDGESLVGFTGGAIDNAFFIGLCGLTGMCRGTSTDLGTGELRSTAATPLPAALPLFATRLRALGLLGWRREQKCQAVT
jgi:hypothetical protein